MIYVSIAFLVLVFLSFILWPIRIHVVFKVKKRVLNEASNDAHYAIENGLDWRRCYHRYESLDTKVMMWQLTKWKYEHWREYV